MNTPWAYSSAIRTISLAHRVATLSTWLAFRLATSARAAPKWRATASVGCRSARAAALPF